MSGQAVRQVGVFGSEYLMQSMHPLLFTMLTLTLHNARSSVTRFYAAYSTREDELDCTTTAFYAYQVLHSG